MKKTKINSFIKQSRILENGAIVLGILILYGLWNDMGNSALNILAFTILFMICSATSYIGKGK